MEKLIVFVGHHPILFGILAGLIIAFALLENKRKGRSIGVNLIGIYTRRDNAKIIDIRDAKEFNQGHITGSVNIPLSQIKTRADELKQSEVPLIFVCNMGHTAASAIELVGHPQAYRLDGGIYAWKSAGLPLVQYK